MKDTSTNAPSEIPSSEKNPEVSAYVKSMTVLSVPDIRTTSADSTGVPDGSVTFPLRSREEAEAQSADTAVNRRMAVKRDGMFIFMFVSCL